MCVKFYRNLLYLCAVEKIRGGQSSVELISNYRITFLEDMLTYYTRHLQRNHPCLIYKTLHYEQSKDYQSYKFSSRKCRFR